MSGDRQSENERHYFERRAAEERAAAEIAIDPLAQRAHSELASCFEDLARSIGATRPTEPLRICLGGKGIATISHGKA
jgi:hypothetical protein